MKKKKLLGTLFTMLMVFSPLLFPCMKTYAESEDTTQSSDATEYTVILKSGKGHGDSQTFKSTDDGKMAKSETTAKAGQFYICDNQVYFVAPDKPDEFSSPENQEGTFIGWSCEKSVYYYSDSINLSEKSGSTLTLTAKWDDSWFKLQTPNEIQINGPGYTTVQCTLTDLHLGSIVDSDGRRKIAKDLTVKFHKGVLEYNGQKTPYLVSSAKSEPGDFALSEKFTEKDKGKQFEISIYISPEDFKNAQIGSYKGNLKFTGLYTYEYVEFLEPAESGTNSSKTEVIEMNNLAAQGNSATIPLKLNHLFPPTGDESSALPWGAVVVLNLLGSSAAWALIKKRK